MEGQGGVAEGVGDGRRAQPGGEAAGVVAPQQGAAAGRDWVTIGDVGQAKGQGVEGRLGGRTQWARSKGVRGDHEGTVAGGEGWRKGGNCGSWGG